jgi:tetratricopeptide (TPR) repeat protein
MSVTFAGRSRHTRRFRILGIILAVAGFLYGAVSGYFYLTATQVAARAELEFRRGQIASARNRLDWVLWFHSHNASANLVLGKIELASGATREAIACFRIIPPDSSLHKMAGIQLATALILDGQITAGEAELKQYLRRYEPTEAVWDLYFRLLYLQTRTRDVISLFEQKLSRPPQLLTDARFLLKAEFVPQDPSETLTTLEEILRKHPDDINAQVALAVGLLRGGEFTRADLLLRSALDRQSDHHRARIVLAQWLADQQKFSAAEDVLWNAADAPDAGRADGIAQDDRYWSLSSRLAERKGETERALQYIDRALQIRENDKQYLSQRAQILRQLLQPEEATITAQQSIEAGQIEQELYLLARQFENRPISLTDCQAVAGLYRKLGRRMRAELWDQLAAQMKQTQAAKSELEGFGIQ